MRKWITLFILLLVAAGAAVLVHVGREGESRIETWIGRELRSIVGAGNRFSLEFSSLDYQAPNRVVMENLRLSLAGHEGEVGTLIEIGKGTIELAQVPRWGEPIVLKTVRLDDPVVRVESFIAAADVADDDKPRSTTRPSLSSILTLRKVEIANGTIRYDDGKGSPLSWTQLNAKLDLETRDGQWHVAHVLIDQPPLMTADVSAELNLDTVVARAINVRASLDLNDPAALRFFTPSLQRMLSTFEVRGESELSVSGIVDLKQKANTDLDMRLTLSSANATVSTFRVPVDRALVSAKMQGMRIQVTPVQVQALRGAVDGRVEITLEGDRPIDAQVITKSIDLNELLKSRNTASESQAAGRVDADLRINSKLPVLLRALKGDTVGVQWGSGYLSVREGRLVRIPVIAQLMNATRRVTGIFSGKGQNRDSFEAQFVVIDKFFDISNMVYRGDGVGLRGKGRINMNGKVALVVNAGPLERIQESLGAVGQFWGKLTDRLMSYSVSGTLKSPNIRPILGGG